MKTSTAIAALVWSVGCLAAPDKLAYELQERCGKQVSTEFKREFGTGIEKTKSGTTITGYRNHFNAKLNACMYLQTSTGFTKVPGKKAAGFNMQRLFDFNENREIGSYFKQDEDARPFECSVSGKICGSKDEWEVLIKPYMEE